MRGLYLVTDRSMCGNKPLEEVVIQAVKAEHLMCNCGKKKSPRVILWRKP